jgi:AcrR family transcriptional regulator
MSSSVEISQSEKILDAAFKCISTKGYANVSLRDIANEAGVVLSQLNYYYKNKEGLFTEVIKVMGKKYIAEFEQCLEGGETTQEKISFFIEFSKEMIKEKSELFRLLYDFISLALWSPSSKELLRNLFNDLSIIIEDNIIDDVSYVDSFKEYNPNSLARLILGTLFGTAIQVMLEPEDKHIVESLDVIQGVF